MSDFNSSLPVRTQSNGDVVVNVADGTIESQLLAIDSSGRPTVNQGAANTAANGWPVKPTDGTNSQSFTAAGEAKVDVTQPLPAGSNTIGSVGVTNLPTTVDTNYGTVGASTIRSAAQVGNATGAASFGNGATGAQTLRTAANLAIGGTDVTSSNPVPVTVESSPGTHINDYKNAAAIAAAATDNHDYTVTAGKTFNFNKVEASASGKMKIDVQVETGVATNVFNTFYSQFNSTATPNMTLAINNALIVAAGVRVRVVATNEDKSAQNLYSTIAGFEI